MYCKKGKERLGYMYISGISLSLSHTRKQKAAGHMPGSTLAIKNRSSRINMAWLCTFRKIYSKDKVEV